MNLLRLLRTSSQPGTDSPDWLIRHNSTRKYANAQLINYTTQLMHYNFKCPTCFALLKRFTHTQDWRETTHLSRSKLSHNHFIRFTKELPTLRMPNQHKRAPQIQQLTRTNLTRQRTRHRLNRTILRTNLDATALQPGQNLTDMHARWKYNHIYIR